jgi:hypothetical protein
MSSEIKYITWSCLYRESMMSANNSDIQIDILISVCNRDFGVI